MPYCLYLRKSRADAEAEAHGEFETLARHESILLELAKRQKLEITEIYKEVISGETISARPVMQKLLEEVGRGLWDGVLVVELERLARGDGIDQGIVVQTFKYSGTKIITPAKTYNPNNEFDEEYFEFGLFMSRREYKAINRRLQRGREAAVKEGKYVASIPPYGYLKIKLEKQKGNTLEPDPKTADIVKLIFSLYVNGEIDENGVNRRLGIQAIARKLNKMRIPPSRHDYWVKETISNILTNPTYIGKVRWCWRPNKKKMINGNSSVERPRNYEENCIIVDALHPAIIEKEVFEKAQEYMKHNPPAPVGYKNELKNPLAGLIICGKCGRKMVLRKGYNKKPDYIICHARDCVNVSSPFSLVEKRVLAYLNKWLEEYKLELNQNNESRNNSSDFSSEILKKSLDRIKTEIELLNKQLNATHDLLEQGIYTAEQFLDRSRYISEQKEQLKKDFDILEKEINLENIRNKNRINIIPKIEHIVKIYDNIKSNTAKNNMLKEILEKAIYIKTKHGGFKGVSPDEFSLVLYPKIPKLQP